MAWEKGQNGSITTVFQGVGGIFLIVPLIILTIALTEMQNYIVEWVLQRLPRKG